MKILIACEFSGIVREAFKKRGHDAWSCDLLDTEIPGQHIKGDVLKVLNDGWDLMLGFPPCTYISRVAIQYNKRPGRLELREQAIAFFMSLRNANILKICLENPIPQKYVTDRIGKWSQKIEPYYFGDPQVKGTCLWLKGLTRLNGKLEVALDRKAHKPKPDGYNGRGNPYYFADALGGNKERSKLRSKTFPGIAKAMAEQWG